MAPGFHTTHTKHITKKGSHMKTLEKYLIYKETTKNEIRLMTQIPQL